VFRVRGVALFLFIELAFWMGMANSTDRDDAPDALDNNTPRAVTYSFVAPTTEQLEELLATTTHLGIARAIAARLGRQVPTVEDLIDQRAAAAADVAITRGPRRA
jgi:hypothetical protein